MDDEDLEFDTVAVDPPPERMPMDRVRKNIWFSKELIADLESIVTEDDSNLTAVVRAACKAYVRRRKEGA